jgi:outer membrane protein assembly factor BamB
MKSVPTLRRWLAAAVTVAVFVGLVVSVALSNRAVQDSKPGEKGQGSSTGWTMFGGSLQRNMVNTTEKNVPIEWSVKKGKEKNIKWVADLGSKSYGGPVISGGKILVGTNNQKPRDPKDFDKVKNEPIDKGVLMCFAETDGKFLWQHAWRKLPSGLVNDWPREGICSTPFIDGDRFYYVGNRCEVICSDLDGKVQWRLDMIKKLGVFPHNISDGSPLVVGNTLFVVTSNGVDEDHINVPAPKAPSFIAVDKKTGNVLWQCNLPTVKLLDAPKDQNQKDFIKRLVNLGQLIQHGQWSNPAYAEVNGKAQVIFPGGDGWLYSFEPHNGKVIWKFDCNPKSARYELEGKGTRSDFIATPVVVDNKVYIGLGQDPEHKFGVGHFWCIDITKKGDVSPELVTDDSVFPPKTKPNPNSALVWHYGGFAEEGKYDRNYWFGRTMSTCAIHDGLVYIAEQEGILHCLDVKTGKQYWEHDTGAQVWSSPFWVDGKIYLGNDDGDVYVFAHGKNKKLLKTNRMGSAVRATPIVVNGVLYVMTENKLYAIAAK